MKSLKVQNRAKRCQSMIHEGHALIQHDPLYLPAEARLIIAQAYRDAVEHTVGADPGGPNLSSPSLASGGTQWLLKEFGSYPQLRDEVAVYERAVERSRIILSSSPSADPQR
jgi:hypothetical protein